MEEYLRKNFELEAKRPSEEALMRWRSAVSVVKNPTRRFRMVADLAKRADDEKKRLNVQEKVKVALYVQKAAIQFMAAGKQSTKPTYKPSKELEESGFKAHPDELGSIVRSHDTKALESHGGLEGIAEEIHASLETGVSSAGDEINLRRTLYGPNKYLEKPPKGFWKFVWDAFQDLTLMILMVSATVSIGVGVATEGFPGGMYDGLGIIFSIILVVTVTAISDYRQSLQFLALDKEKKNLAVQVTRDGCRNKVSIFDLVVGDIVHLSIGDQVPADGLFVSGYSLTVDESSLSGESEPVSVGKEAPFLLSGTKVQDGSGKMIVTAVGMRTEWGRLMETLSEEDSESNETPLQVKLNGVATIIGKIGLVFAAMTFFVLTVRYLANKASKGEIKIWGSEDFLELLNYFAIAVIIIVVAVPEGLPLAVTLSLAFAMKKLMSDKALVRHLSACETMGSATCICSDKTGTLTTNHMVVTRVWTAEKEFTGDALRTELSNRAIEVLLQSIFQNTSSEVAKGKDGKERTIGSPTEIALMEFGLSLGGNPKAFDEDYEVLKVEPFNSSKKKMSVLVKIPKKAGGGSRAFCKGASEIVLGMCDRVLNSAGDSVPLSDDLRAKVSKVIEDFACEALRTLCLAFRDVKEGSESDSDTITDQSYTLISVVGIKDPVRPGVKEAVKACLEAGITVRMVTGDNINTAKAIAKECGILTEDGLAIEGPDFRNKSPAEIDALLPKLQVMARSMPLDKHTLVSHLRRELKEVVAVTGDGTNDAPALHEADIGLSMGIAGTEVAKENSDIIIMDDNFTTIVNVVRWGRAVYINIQKFVQFQLTVNVVALMLNFISACVSGSAPLTAVQMLWVNLIMDTLGALALATEPPNDGLMRRPPIGRNVMFITPIMWRNIIGQSIYQIIVLLVLKFRGKELLNLSGADSTTIVNTLIFNSFVFCQIFNEVNSRDMEKINVFKGMFDSWPFMIVMVTTVAFQAIIVEFLGFLAETVPLSWELWGLSVLIGAVSLFIAVILKCIPVKSSAIQSQHDGYEALPSGPEQV